MYIYIYIYVSQISLQATPVSSIPQLCSHVPQLSLLRRSRHLQLGLFLLQLALTLRSLPLRLPVTTLRKDKDNKGVIHTIDTDVCVYTIRVW